MRQGALMLDLRASCLRLVGMNTDIPSADLQRLLGVARTALNDLAKRANTLCDRSSQGGIFPRLRGAEADDPLVHVLGRL